MLALLLLYQQRLLLLPLSLSQLLLLNHALLLAELRHLNSLLLPLTHTTPRGACSSLNSRGETRSRGDHCSS